MTDGGVQAAETEIAIEVIGRSETEIEKEIEIGGKVLTRAEGSAGAAHRTEIGTEAAIVRVCLVVFPSHY